MFVWRNADGWPVEYVSDNVTHLFGWEKADFLSGRISYARTVHPDDLPRVEREVLRHSADPGTLQFVHAPYRIITQSGEARWVEDHTTILRENGKAIGYEGFLLDASERKRTEAALETRLMALTRPPEDVDGISFEILFNLADLQDLQDRFARAVGVASIITRPDGTPITKPSSFCQLCIDIIRKTEKGKCNCYKSDAALGRVHAGGPIIQPCMSGGLWDAGASISVGGRHIANWLIGQVRDETQTEDAMVAYAREIGADEKAFMEAFRKVPAMTREKFGFVADALFAFANQLSAIAYQNVQQARFIEDRNRAEKEKEALQAQVQQAQRLEAVGRLAGGVAHDLNNMLSPILGYGELLQEDFAPDDHRKAFVQHILEAGIRARDIVRQLLAFSRKQTMEIKLHDFNGILTQFEKLLRRTIREDIAITLRLGPNLPNIRGDAGQLEQVIMNLAVNAQDAMPDGGVLTMETSRAEVDDARIAACYGIPQGAYVVFAVRDTGGGMDAETQKRIFDPFFSTKGLLGTGLGLATVYGIVKQHGGHIWVYSEPGKGSIFKVYIPVSGETTVESRPSEANAGPLPGTETILLVEDNEPVRTMAREILGRLGYRVLASDNGAVALKLLTEEEGPVHLLLSDVVMPAMNGKELFLAAKKIRPDLKVLFMSGYTENVIAHRGILDEGIAFIQKPFSTGGLSLKIREILAAPPQPEFH